MKKQKPKTRLIELLLASIKGLKEKNSKQVQLLDILNQTKFNFSKFEETLKNKVVMDHLIKQMIDDDVLGQLDFEVAQKGEIENLIAYRISKPEELSEEKKKEILRDLITRIRLDPKDWKDVRIRLDSDWKKIERIRLDKNWNEVERIRLDNDWKKNLNIRLKDIRIDPDWDKKL